MEVCKLSSKAIKKINPLISSLGTVEHQASSVLGLQRAPPDHNQKGNQGKFSPLEPPFKITYFRQTIHI